MRNDSHSGIRGQVPGCPGTVTRVGADRCGYRRAMEGPYAVRITSSFTVVNMAVQAGGDHTHACTHTHTRTHARIHTDMGVQAGGGHTHTHTEIWVFRLGGTTHMHTHRYGCSGWGGPHTRTHFDNPRACTHTHMDRTLSPS